MGEVLIRTSKVQEELLERFVEEGYYKTKSEAIRAGIMQLAKDFDLVKDEDFYRELVMKSIKKKPMSLKKLFKEIELLEKD